MGAELVHSKYRAEGTQLHGTRTMRTERPSCLGCVSKRVRGTWTCDGDACTRQTGDSIYPVHLFSDAPPATTVPKAFSFARIAGAVRPASRLFLHLRWHVPPNLQPNLRLDAAHGCKKKSLTWIFTERMSGNAWLFSQEPGDLERERESEQRCRFPAVRSTSLSLSL